MGELGPELVGEIVEVCKAAGEEAAEALRRGINTDVKVSVGEPGTLDLQALPEGFSGAGLVVVLFVGDSGAVVVLAENTGLLPEWCAEPDATGQSKLTTLAQELAMILLPEAYLPDDFKAGWVKSVSGALARGGVSDGGSLIPLELESADGRRGMAGLIWPVGNPAAVLGKMAANPESKPEPKPTPAPKVTVGAKAKSQPAAKPKSGSERKTAAGPTPPSLPSPPRRPATLGDLPTFTRSLLRIKLPVVVTLAEKRQPLGMILELGPGSIIQFDKSCEEMLQLEVSGRPVATGEAVKVGDKFGLRVNSIVLPEERFAAFGLEKDIRGVPRSPAVGSPQIVGGGY
jgi:flagellar motor switch/type III secretory pathway protein FliN